MITQELILEFARTSDALDCAQRNYLTYILREKVIHVRNIQRKTRNENGKKYNGENCGE